METGLSTTMPCSLSKRDAMADTFQKECSLLKTGCVEGAPALENPTIGQCGSLLIRAQDVQLAPSL